jgi:hypothetical protein
VEALWRSDEAALLRFMERRDVGYVVAGRAIFEGLRLHGQGPWLETGINVAFFRKLPVALLMLGGSGSAQLELPHLTRLLPRHASVWRSASNVPYPASWVYERVAGARVRGRAPPNSVVRLQLPMRVRDVALRHEAWTRADAQGAFEIVTPLPTGYSADGIETADRALLEIPGRGSQPVSVPESSVRGGAALDAGG